MRLLLLALLIACVLSACGRAPAYSPMRAQEMASASNFALCRHYGSSRQASVVDELSRRGLFTATEMAQIRQGTVEVGSTSLAVICTRGVPLHVSKTTSASGERMVYQYENGSVTFSAGVVESVHQLH